jgi:hypothetical protein
MEAPCPPHAQVEIRNNQVYRLVLRGKRCTQVGLPPERFRLGIGSGAGPHPLQRLHTTLNELRPLVDVPIALAGARSESTALIKREGSRPHRSRSFSASAAQGAPVRSAVLIRAECRKQWTCSLP